MRFNSNAHSWALLVRNLMEGPCTVTELQEVTGLRRMTLYEWLANLHAANAARISAWELDRNNRPTVAVWVLEEGPHAKRPPKQPRTIKNMKLREKNRNERITGVAAQ